MKYHKYTIQVHPALDTFLLKFVAYSDEAGGKIAGPAQIENLLGEATFNIAKNCNYHPKNVLIDEIQFKETKVGLDVEVICPNNEADITTEDHPIEIRLFRPDGEVEVIKSYENKFNNHTFIAINEKASEILDVFPSGIHINNMTFVYAGKGSPC